MTYQAKQRPHITALRLMVAAILAAAAWTLAEGIAGKHRRSIAVDRRPTAKVFRAGAYALDITPTIFPVIVNGMFEERTASVAHDRLYARCLVLDDGASRMAIAVVDSCMIPRELLDQAKELARQTTGIPTDHMLISATHTHSAPSVMGVLGSSEDPEYSRFLAPRIARGIQLAAENLGPAQVGWAAVDDFEHTHCRRWIRRPDKMTLDPFGERTVRANMHPGYQNSDAIGPSGPVDPGLSILSVRSPDGRPIALLANYSMHYFGSTPVSADYFGRFAEQFTTLIGAEGISPPFVGIMSQGTSGDQHWMDYSKPDKEFTLEEYARGVARVAGEAYRKIRYLPWAPMAMAETKLTLRRRVPDPQRLSWAKQIVAKMEGSKPRNLTEIYAREQILLHEQPIRELKLQAIRLGELGITALPNEVYGLTGLKIKAQSPLETTFNIELANGAEGYIPPPEQHKLGGYTTWPARTAGLEVQAEPKIVDTLLGLLEKVSGKARRKVIAPQGPYAKAVLDSKPVAYWRLGEMNGPQAIDASGNRHHGTYEDLVVFYLPGPDFLKISSEDGISRAAHFAGGRMRATVKDLGQTYTVEMWFRNGLPADAREVTGYLFSRGPEAVEGAPGDHLAVGGTRAAMGRLVFFSGGTDTSRMLAGTSDIPPKTWNHVVLERTGKRLAVYLNGNRKPEITGEAEIEYPARFETLFIGGRSDNFANFEGKISEVSVFNRPLTPAEIEAHYRASGFSEKSERSDVPPKTFLPVASR